MLPRNQAVDLSESQLSELLSAAERAADAAAEITCRYFRSDFTISNKASGTTGFDPVTEADRLAELAIRDSLRKDFPDIGFFGEEHEALAGSSDLLWVVDPIDGTRAFMSGMPLWGTLIGLFNGQEAVLGVMDQPFLNERYVGANGSTHLIDAEGQRVLSTRRVANTAAATLYCTTPDMFSLPAAKQRFETIRDSVQLTRYGGDCYAYALLAAGFVDIVLDCDLKPYDIVALIPIVQSAGGVVSGWQGESAVDGGYIVACASQELHEAVLEVLRR
ncbi:MAG: histidinol-phosphatase [Granulosicoccus sp.]|nr:histidinol-phosphatase [Granulosicoccus sp.]